MAEEKPKQAKLDQALLQINGINRFEKAFYDALAQLGYSQNFWSIALLHIQFGIRQLQLISLVLFSAGVELEGELINSVFTWCRFDLNAIDNENSWLIIVTVVMSIELTIFVIQMMMSVYDKGILSILYRWVSTIVLALSESLLFVPANALMLKMVVNIYTEEMSYILCITQFVLVNAFALISAVFVFNISLKNNNGRNRAHSIIDLRQLLLAGVCVLLSGIDEAFYLRICLNCVISGFMVYSIFQYHPYYSIYTNFIEGFG